MKLKELEIEYVKRSPELTKTKIGENKWRFTHEPTEEEHPRLLVTFTDDDGDDWEFADFIPVGKGPDELLAVFLNGIGSMMRQEGSLPPGVGLRSIRSDAERGRI